MGSIIPMSVIILFAGIGHARTTVLIGGMPMERNTESKKAFDVTRSTVIIYEKKLKSSLYCNLFVLKRR